MDCTTIWISYTKNLEDATKRLDDVPLSDENGKHDFSGLRKKK
jgi:hypothetical protein